MEKLRSFFGKSFSRLSDAWKRLSIIKRGVVIAFMVLVGIGLTSLFAINPSSTARPSGCLKSSVTLSLFRLMLRKYALSPFSRPPAGGVRALG